MWKSVGKLLITSLFGQKTGKKGQEKLLGEVDSHQINFPQLPEVLHFE